MGDVADGSHHIMGLAVSFAFSFVALFARSARVPADSKTMFLES
jgi:hypothetical protein